MAVHDADRMQQQQPPRPAGHDFRKISGLQRIKRFPSDAYQANKKRSQENSNREPIRLERADIAWSLSVGEFFKISAGEKKNKTE